MKLQKGIIISCQATVQEPLYGLDIMKDMARSAVIGGAVGIRCLADELSSIRKTVNVPIIGLIKEVYDDSSVYITPTKKELDKLISLCPDVIAIDATHRERPFGETLEGLVAYAKKQAPDILLMADCAELKDVERAIELGFDYVGSTMRGYTDATKGVPIPDYDFLNKVHELAGDKFIAEGGIWERDQLAKVLACKPFAVVIGTAVTRPKDITARFVNCYNEVKCE